MKFTKITVAIFTVALTALSLIACGDDSSGTAASNNPFSPTGGYVYQLSVNEATQTLIVSMSREVGDCALVDGEPQWLDGGLKVYADTNTYEIKGDTLILHTFKTYDDEVYDRKNFLIGKNNGRLYGTWEALLCDDDDDDGVQECSLSPYATETITFTQSTATVNFSLRENADFTKTDLAYYIVQALYNGSGFHEIYASDFDDQDQGGPEFDVFLQENNITYQKVSNKQANFTINGQVYTFSLTSAEESMESRLVEATVTTLSSTCYLKDFEEAISKETCNSRDIYDMSGFHECGIEYEPDSIVYNQLIHENHLTNIDEFRECIRSIAQQPSSDIPYLYKRAAKEAKPSKKNSWFARF